EGLEKTEDPVSESNGSWKSTWALATKMVNHHAMTKQVTGNRFLYGKFIKSIEFQIQVHTYP
ncbi:MAG: hypothetical protein ACKOA1_11440, partial [Bacteroidota bacterium]